MLAYVVSFTILLFGTISFMGFYAVKASLEWVIEEPSLKHLGIALFYLPFVSGLVFVVVREMKSGFNADDFRVRIVPYFEKPIIGEFVGRDHPFFHGRQMAKSLRKLDRYAIAAGRESTIALWI